MTRRTTYDPELERIANEAADAAVAKSDKTARAGAPKPQSLADALYPHLAINRKGERS